MSRMRKFIFGLALSFASALAPMGAAQAMPLAVPNLNVEAGSDIVNAQYYGHRPRYQRPRYGAPRRYYRPPVQRGYNAHVRWCLNRYRTYNPSTNRYHAGGGVYRACYSPYR